MSPRRTAVGALALLAVMAAPHPGLAHDHRPPPISLVTGGRFQRGALWYDTWGSCHGDAGVVQNSDGSGQAPGMPVASRERTVSIRFRKIHRPDEVVVRVWRDVNDDMDLPAGASFVKWHRLLKWRDDGRQVGWRAVFRMTVKGHRYIRVFARWDGRECPEPEIQEVMLGFHLEPRTT